MSSSDSHMIPANDSKRLHALDALRAAMMLSIIGIHTANNYTLYPLGEFWSIKDARTSLAFDVLTLLLHTYSLPIFFLLSGLLACRSYRRSGPKLFLSQRLKRIFLPLCVAWIILYVPIHSAFRYFRMREIVSPWVVIRSYFTSAQAWQHADLMHLWFLYYLLILTAVAVLFDRGIWQRAPQAIKARFHNAFRQIVRSPWKRLIIPTAVTTVALCWMPTGHMDAGPDRWLPIPRLLFGYGFFFVVGWGLSSCTELLPTFRRGAWLELFFAFVLLPLNAASLARVMREMPAPEGLAHAAAAVTGALLIWLFALAFLGLAMRYANDYSPAWRALGDASYWIYLVHMPLVVWTAIALLPLPWPAFVKFALVFGVSVTVPFALYHWGLRNTALAAYVGGTRLRSTSVEPPG